MAVTVKLSQRTTMRVIPYNASLFCFFGDQSDREHNFMYEWMRITNKADLRYMDEACMLMTFILIFSIRLYTYSYIISFFLSCRHLLYTKSFFYSGLMFSCYVNILKHCCIVSLQGARAKEKNELLFQRFDINYNMLPAMFRKGSCVFRDKVPFSTLLSWTS